jgi:hypothetical protein
MSVISVMVFSSTAAVGEIAAKEFAPEFACSMQHDEGSGTRIDDDVARMCGGRN